LISLKEKQASTRMSQDKQDKGSRKGDRRGRSQSVGAESRDQSSPVGKSASKVSTPVKSKDEAESEKQQKRPHPTSTSPAAPAKKGAAAPAGLVTQPVLVEPKKAAVTPSLLSQALASSVMAQPAAKKPTAASAAAAGAASGKLAITDEANACIREWTRCPWLMYRSCWKVPLRVSSRVRTPG
jgi:hypothetical protein